MGTVRREPGQGCGSCVHRKYCQAFYWFYRNAQFPSRTGKAGEELDTHLGIQCNSWSNDPAQRITTWNQADLDYNEHWGETDPILIEPFSSGIDDPVTASDRDQS